MVSRYKATDGKLRNTITFSNLLAVQGQGFQINDMTLTNETIKQRLIEKFEDR